MDKMNAFASDLAEYVDKKRPLSKKLQKISLQIRRFVVK
jgi:hypothetical protein